MDDERKETRDEAVEIPTDVVEEPRKDVVETSVNKVEIASDIRVEIPRENLINLDNLSFGLDNINIF